MSFRYLGFSFVFASILLSATLASAQNWPQRIRELQQRRASKQQLSVAYNNYALSLSRSGDWRNAERNMVKAMQLDPMDKELRDNAAIMYLNRATALVDGKIKQRNAGAEAVRLATRALQYRPKWAEAYLLIGDVEYDAQRLDKAKFNWNKAKHIKPSWRTIDDRLKRLKTESTVESKLSKGGNAHFNLRYQKKLSDAAAKRITEGLSKTRKVIGRQFKFWPNRRIVVLIYTPEGFRKVRRGPEWAVGVYDGKIRVKYPLDGFEATLVHEYTHALISDLSRRRCPRWLNEGMAEYQEARIRKPSVDLLRVAARLDKLISIDQLSSALQNSNSMVAGLAYQQSFSIVTYLAQKHQFFRFTKLLKSMGNSDSFEVALQNEFHLTPEQLESEWRDWLPSFVR